MFLSLNAFPPDSELEVAAEVHVPAAFRTSWRRGRLTLAEA